MLPPQPPRVFSLRSLRLYFPTLEPWVARSISLPCLSSQFICTGMWDCPVHRLPCPPADTLLQVLSTHLPVSAPPTGVHECFFFISLVVGLPYSWIFCHFSLVFVFKFVVLLLIVRGGTVCLTAPPSWPEVSVFNFGGKFYIVFQNGCTILHSHQQKRFPFSPHPYQHLFIGLLMTAILAGVR